MEVAMILAVLRWTNTSKLVNMRITIFRQCRDLWMRMQESVFTYFITKKMIFVY